MNRQEQSTHLPIGTRLGEYEIQEVLGQGGFGITYKAWDATLACFVALKEYFPKHLANRSNDSVSIRPISADDASSYEKGLHSFVEEARTLAQFQHPGVVPVKRMVKANNTAYMVMGFVEGQTLSEYMRDHNSQVEPSKLVAWTEQILDALEKVHAAGLLHRDIKPGNVYIGSDGHAMLLDFGAARRVAAEASQSITGVISAGYSPIEQYSESTKNQGPWTDIYSLSATLYRCITGEKPIEATTRRDDMDDGDPDPIPPIPPEAFPQYPAGFINAVSGGLVVIRKNRIQSVAQFRAMMKASGSTASPKPKPTPAPQATPKSVPKNRPDDSVHSGPHAVPPGKNSTTNDSPTVSSKRGLHLTLIGIVVVLVGVVAVNPFKSDDPIIDLGGSNTDADDTTVDTIVEPELHDVIIRVTPENSVNSISVEGQRIRNGVSTQLETGQYQVNIDAIDPYQDLSAEFNVNDKSTDFRWELSTRTVPMRLNVTPSNARVVLPDLPASVTYFNGIELAAQEHRVRFIAPGYETLTTTIDLRDGSDWNVRLTRLDPLASFSGQFVSIPSGSFLMGGDRYNDEAPIHRVYLDSFQLQANEVKWGDYKLCVNDGVCSAPSGSTSFADNEPVRGVSWNDAQNFIRWINSKTSGGYRLPSEAEWEYAARAGTEDRYPTGAKLYCSEARFGRAENGDCYDGTEGPVAVRSYSPNSFGLYDMSGNVIEWLEDCFYNDYNGAPEDGSAWIRDSACTVRAMRGGGWASSMESSALPYRNSDNVDSTFTDVGFRLAKD